MKTLQNLAISFLLFFVGCNGVPKEPKFHITVGLNSYSLQRIIKHHPVRITVEMFETSEEIEIIIHRDDKKGK